MKKMGSWLVVLPIALVACIFYYCTLFDFIYPGPVAEVHNIWFDITTYAKNPSPVAGFFIKPFGLSCYNYVAPILGTLSIISLFFLVRFFIQYFKGPGVSERDNVITSNVGAAVAAITFAMTPAVMDSSRYVEPAMFDLLWALLAFVVLTSFHTKKSKFSFLRPVLAGCIVAIGVLDSYAFFLLLPLYIIMSWSLASRRGQKGYVESTFFFLSFIVALLIIAIKVDVGTYVTLQEGIMRKCIGKNVYFWLAIPLFAIIPFLITLFSGYKAFSGEKGVVLWIFHAIMSLVSIIALVTPYSPSRIMAPTGYPSVLSCAFVAFTAGCIVAFWYGQTRIFVTVDKDGHNQNSVNAAKTTRVVGYVGGSIYSFIVLFAMLMTLAVELNLTIGSDSSVKRNVYNGSFVTHIAEQFLDDMGERSWVIYYDADEGSSFDECLLHLAKKRGKNLKMVYVNRQNDDAYVQELKKVVMEEAFCNEEDGQELTKELIEILEKKVENRENKINLFIEHWFKNDPNIVNKAVVWGRSYIWGMYANIEDIPETYFFGGDPKRRGDWSTKWPEIKDVLPAPENWGSYIQFDANRKLSVIEKECYYLRRHIGMIATCQGAFYNYEGIKNKNSGKTEQANALFDKAFSLYELVLNDIDCDNVSSLKNQKFLGQDCGCKNASDKMKLLDERMKIIEARKYGYPTEILYGSSSNPKDIYKLGRDFISLGGGLYSYGCFLVDRAIKLMPKEEGKLLNLTLNTGLLINGGRKSEARAIYSQELQNNPQNRFILSKLADLEASDGNIDKAVEYLRQALRGVEDDENYVTLKAKIHLLKNENDIAEKILRSAVNRNKSDLSSRILLAITMMQQVYSLDTNAEIQNLKVNREVYIREIEEKIIKELTDLCAPKYLVDSLTAKVLQLKGGAENMRKARDILQGVNRSSRDVLALDMSLGDEESAEKRALDMLKIDPKNSLANYVMGTIYLKRDNLDKAERCFKITIEDRHAIPWAYNDLAEVCYRKKKFDEAESYARIAVAKTPKLHVVWHTLGSILFEAGKNFDEVESCAKKACDLCTDKNGNVSDVRMLILRAKVHIKKGETVKARNTLNKVRSREKELSDYERQELNNILKDVR